MGLGTLPNAQKQSAKKVWKNAVLRHIVALFLCNSVTMLGMEKRHKTKRIMPAIMPESYDDIREKARLVMNAVDTVQLDLMDGEYVPPRTYPFRPGGKFSPRAIQYLEENGLPFWQELNYELDLMVARPERFLESFLTFSPSRIIVHFASVHNWEKVISFSEELSSLIEFGLAVTVFDSLEKVEKILDRGSFSFVQCMGIEKIGYMGQEFTEEVFPLIEWVRKHYPELAISVDGGVSEHTIEALAEAGVNRFVSGSAVYHHGIPEENVHFLDSLVEGVHNENE